MTLLEKTRSIADLWRVLIPFCTPPEPRQFALWANRFNTVVIEKAFWRASKKFSPERVQLPDAVVVHRYVTGVCLNEEREAVQITTRRQ